MSFQVVRQEGFQLPSPPHTTDSPSNDSTSPPPPDTPIFMPHNLAFLPDPSRKFPSAAAAHHMQHAGGLDITDDLASLLPGHDSHERSTAPHHPHHHDQQQQQQQQYRHNIFDISAPSTASSHFSLRPDRPENTADLYGSNSVGTPGESMHAHFNSTLPALNSSMRYEPHPDPPPAFAYRHTPSPNIDPATVAAQASSPVGDRSRSRSVGPTRNRRDRRGSSISGAHPAHLLSHHSHHLPSTSPPPGQGKPHPQAIMIPGRTASRGVQPVSPLSAWFQPSPSQFTLGGQGQNGEYSLPTPESLTNQPFAAFHASTTPSGNPQNVQNGHNANGQNFAPGFHPGVPFYGGNGAASGMGGMSSSVPPMGMSMPNANGTNAWRGSTPSNGGMGISPSEVSIHPGHVHGHHHSHSHSHSTGHAKKPSATASELDMLSTSLPAHHGSPVSAGPGGHDPLTLLSEKRRRRRESHNAVERRRRDNINERISELAGLIPSALFDCDSPLPLPTAQSLSVIIPGITGEPGSELPADLSALNPDGAQNTPATLNHDELFAMCEEGDEFSLTPSANGGNGSSAGVVKKDPSEDGDSKLGGANGQAGIAVGANGQETTIKANKGMILRKSVEYIRYLQQLVAIQASRSRDLEERNRRLESELGIPHAPDSSAPSLDGQSDDGRSLHHQHQLQQQQQQSEMLADVPEGVEGEEDEERGRRRERKGELNGVVEHEPSDDDDGSMESRERQDTAMEE